jgi:hypothetical protein
MCLLEPYTKCDSSFTSADGFSDFCCFQKCPPWMYLLSITSHFFTEVFSLDTEVSSLMPVQHLCQYVHQIATQYLFHQLFVKGSHFPLLPIFQPLELNSVALVRKRTIPTERLPLVGEVIWCQPLQVEGVAWSAIRIPTVVNLFSRPEPVLFHSSSSSIVLTRLSGPPSRPLTSQKTW